MHKKIKITSRICIFILVAALFATLPIAAFATSGEGDNKGTEFTESEQSFIGAQKDESGNLFDSLFSALEDNLSEVLSALAFIGSIIIMLCYKRGLIPLIKDGLTALSAGVKRIGEKTSELNAEANGITEQLNGRLEDAQKLLCTMENTLTELTSRLDALEDEKDERKKLRTVLTAEVDMLYEIFCSAALPQYLKDSVGERIAKMRAEISDVACNDED